jgi:hypothetical protein
MDLLTSGFRRNEVLNLHKKVRKHLKKATQKKITNNGKFGFPSTKSSSTRKPKEIKKKKRQ